MFCDACGVKMYDSQRFCPSCGKPAGSMPFMPVQSRTAGHVRLVGILWIALSALHLLPGFVLTMLIRHGGNTIAPGMPWPIVQLMHVIGGLLLVTAGFGIATGWGLLDRQPWARPMALVMACFSLINPPFGTALGIYTMWTLLPAESEAEYRRLSRVA